MRLKLAGMLLALGFGMFSMPDSASAQSDVCSYCASAWSCVVDNGEGGRNSTCWDEGSGNCYEDNHVRCTIRQTYGPELLPSERLDLITPQYGQLALARVGENVYAAWRECDGSVALVATTLSDGRVVLSESAGDVPRYEEWIANRPVVPAS